MDAATHAIPTYTPSLTPLEAIRAEIEYIKELLISLHSNMLNISQALSNLSESESQTPQIEPTIIPTTLWTQIEHSTIEQTPETPLFPGWERKRKKGEEVDRRWGSFGEFMRDGAGIGIQIPSELGEIDEVEGEMENLEGLIGGTDSNEELERDIERGLNRNLFGDENEIGNGDEDMGEGSGKKVCADGSIRGQYEECP